MNLVVAAISRGRDKAAVTCARREMCPQAQHSRESCEWGEGLIVTPQVLPSHRTPRVSEDFGLTVVRGREMIAVDSVLMKTQTLLVQDFHGSSPLSCPLSQMHSTEEVL